MVGIISYADHRSNESAIFGDIPPPLYLPCSGRVDHWAKVAGFPSFYSQLITAEFSTNYLMVRYPNIKIYVTEVKYRFHLSVFDRVKSRETLIQLIIVCQ